MKYRYLFGIGFILLLTCCEKETSRKVPSVGKITYGDCKPVTKKSGESEYLEYKTVDTDYLQINHINAWFNCEPGEIFVTAELINGAIVIDAYEDPALANCICPYDLSYRIGPLKYGRYIIRILRGDIKFSINFKSSTNGFFIIE